MARRKNPLTVTRHTTRLGSDVKAEGVFAAGPDGEVQLVKLTFTAPEGTSVTAADLRGYPLSLELGAATRFLLATAQEHDPEVVAVMTRPDGSDRWYQEYAAVFLLARSRSKAPAVLIAEQNDVPVSAVHRWTREARRRGFLPTDPRGKRTK